jgi:lycopene beta-cyclase
VLPIVLDGDAERFWSEAGTSVARAGMRAMLFHHTTGYSLPDAVRLADLVASMRDLATVTVATTIRDLALRRWREQSFFRLLNRLMFRAAAPAERYRTLEHFYRLPEELIGRFYAGHPRRRDALRVLSGRPPVPLMRALAVMAGGRA